MPKEYNWVIQYAARDKKRGRGVGGDNRSEEKHQDRRSTKRNTGNNFPFFSVDLYTVTN